MKPLLGSGLLLSEHTLWKDHHRLVAPAFLPISFQSVLPEMAERTMEMIKAWKHQVNGNVDPWRTEMSSWLSRLTLDNVGIMAFGHHLGALNANQPQNSIFDEVSYLLRSMQVRVLFSVFGHPWDYFPFSILPPQLKFKRANKKIHDLARTTLEKRRMEVEKNRVDSLERDKGKMCLLDSLILAQKQYGWSDKEVEDEMITTIMGGHETTSSTLTWMLYLLCKNPDVTQKVKEEFISKVVGSEEMREGESIVFEQLTDQKILAFFKKLPYHLLNKLTYLHNVINETLRLYPSAPVLNRTTNYDMELGGYNVPKDTEVIILPWHLHRDPRHWPNPESFLPDRWKHNKDIGNFTYLPFGAGSRKCLGQSFAYAELKLVILMILFSGLSISLDYQTKSYPPKPEMAITLRPHRGLPVKVSLQQQS